MKLVAVGVALLLVGCPSKKKREQERDEVIAKLNGFAQNICDCKDKECAKKVADTMTKWSVDNNAQMPDATEAQTKKMAEIGMKYAACMDKLLQEDQPMADVPPPATKPEADMLLRSGREWMSSAHPRHRLQGVTVWYVDQTGALDDQYGRIYLVFGYPPPPGDDPKRKTGAPVPEPAKTEACLSLTWDRQGGWSNIPTECPDTWNVGIRCAVTDIWKRSVAMGDPADALATIEIRTSAESASWHFSIEDEPRNVHVAHQFPDDCPLAVEK